MGDARLIDSALAGVVVSDLVASTRLRVVLGEDDADDLWRAHAGLLRAVAERPRGRIVR